MFERRLKIILLILFVATGVLVLRAAQVQLVQRVYWAERAEKAMVRPQWVETGRGRIVDFRGRAVAEDVASTDACVDYRAVLRTPDPKWVEQRAIDRLRTRTPDAYRRASTTDRRAMREDEAEQVRADVDRMWEKLAAVSRLPDETPDAAVARVEDVRQSIVARVEMRRRYLWYRNYEKAVEQHASKDQARGWESWLLDGGSSATPEVDKFIITVAEQLDAHVVLRAVSPVVASELGRDVEKYPGLVLRPSTHRFYPFGATAAHVLGHLSRVNADDLKDDPNARTDGDELRQYFPNDLIGRTGAEALCEPALRGRRGLIERRLGEQNEVVGKPTPSENGQDVRLSIDVELQQAVQALFEKVPIKDFDEATPIEVPMYGAAVVIDVPTGQVRALASYPSFNPNELDEQFAELSADDINRPMLNRATQLALEPGSTVKPMVGLSAVTQGVLGPYEGIECTGYLVLGRTRYRNGRCWTASKFGAKNPDLVAHHQIPQSAPHRGHHGNADGFLTLSDGLERSCNVYFEAVADRLGMEGLSDWYDKWGLGRPTGIGIAEVRGLLPRSYKGPSLQRRMTTWFSGIGQGHIHATPLQMANVAATIARNGVWKRPTLLAPDASAPFTPTIDGPDTVDLHLSPEGLAEARAGMVRVVNSPAGTGTHLISGSKILQYRVKIGGKTGTAQAAKFSIVVRDPVTRKPVIDEKTGRYVREWFEPHTPGNPGGMPWYRGSGSSHTDLAHAWYIGYAPADNPKIAFCVFVEYGGSGGVAAAPIATGMLEACVEHGYLPLDAK